MLRAIIFDMGGTLDGDGHWLDRFVRLYAEHRFDCSRDTIRRGFDHAERCAATDKEIVNANLETLVRRHLAWQFAEIGLDDDGRREAMVSAFVAPVQRAARQNADTLAALRRRGLTLGLVSNACGNAQALCDDFGYTPYLSAVIDSRVVGAAKPDPRIFTMALERLGVSAGETMMVGDSYERDVVPAHRLGMQTRWLVSGDRPASLGDADGCIDRIDDLLWDLGIAERASA
jgi:putative hydrolase of the HAD superfamily